MIYVVVVYGIEKKNDCALKFFEKNNWAQKISEKIWALTLWKINRATVVYMSVLHVLGIEQGCGNTFQEK